MPASLDGSGLHELGAPLDLDALAARNDRRLAMAATLLLVGILVLGGTAVALEVYATPPPAPVASGGRSNKARTEPKPIAPAVAEAATTKPSVILADSTRRMLAAATQGLAPVEPAAGGELAAVAPAEGPAARRSRRRVEPRPMHGDSRARRAVERSIDVGTPRAAATAATAATAGRPRAETKAKAKAKPKTKTKTRAKAEAKAKAKREPIPAAEPEPEPIAEPTPRVATSTKTVEPGPKPEPAPKAMVAAPAPTVDPEAGAKAKALLERGKLRMRSGDPRGAAAAYRDALWANPGDSKAAMGLARAYYAMNKIGDARRTVSKLLKRRPTHGRALLLMASMNQDQGRSREARQHYEKYLAAHPTGSRASEVRSILKRL